MATNIKKIKTSAGDHDIDAKLWNGMSTDSPNFTSSVGISGKSYIRSNIDPGELKVCRPNTNDGFIIRTGGSKVDSLYQLQLLSTNGSYSYQYNFPRESGDVLIYKSVTYSNLVSLKNNSNLVPGAVYRITDYVTYSSTYATNCANNQFDILVTALTSNALSEDAKVCLHSGSTSYYNSNGLSSWEIKYCIDNDATRFQWINGTETTRKGVIYYMKDEFENEAPYDFKNIRFEKDENGVTKSYYTFSYIDSNGNIYDASVKTKNVHKNKILPSFDPGDKCAVLSNNIFKLTESKVYSTEGDECILNYIGENSKNNTFENNCICNILNNYCSNNIFGRQSQYNILGEYCTDNTFGGQNQQNIFDIFCTGNTFGLQALRFTFGSKCQNNTFGNYCNSNTFGKNCSNNDFLSSCVGNSFGNNFSDNTFGLNCEYNTFGNNCSNNTFGKNCSNNTIGNYLSSNTIGDSFKYNTFGNGCFSNEIGNSFFHNTFGNSCDKNKFSKDCESNNLGNECTGNTFGEDSDRNYLQNRCTDNVFGNGCNDNSLGNDCKENVFGIECDGNVLCVDCANNSFGNYCEANTLNNKCKGNVFGNYFCKNSLGNGCDKLNFLTSQTTSETNKAQNITVHNGINSGSSNMLDVNIPVLNNTYQLTVARNSIGKLNVYCEADVDSNPSNTINCNNADYTYTLTSNVYTKFINAKNLRIIFNTKIDIVHNFMFEVTFSTDGCTLTIPSTVTRWANGITPGDCESNCTYQISIIDNLGVIVRFDDDN